MSRPSRVFSLFIAFGFLRVAAPAAQTTTANAQRERTPTLAAEASTQLELAFRANPNEGQARKEQLDAAVEAWRAAPRTEANNERLVNWLRSAIRASMPGSHDEMPAPPTFADGTGRNKQQLSKATPSSTRTPEPTLAVPAPKPSKSIGQTDPFRDDPADMQFSK